MTNFRSALIAEKPLYVDGTMRVNFTVDELVNFVEDYLKDNQPILTVEVHEANCGHRFEMDIGGHQRCIYCGVIKILSFDDNELNKIK